MRLIDTNVFLNDSTEMRDYEHTLQECEIDAKPVRYEHWIKNDNSAYSCSERQAWIPNLAEIRRWCIIYLATQLPFWVLLVLFN